MTEPVKNIYTQLLLAQAEIPTIEKDVEVRAGKKYYKHASLPNVLSKVLPALRKHGIVFSSTVATGIPVALSDDMIQLGILDCYLYYGETSESIKCPIPLLIRDGKEFYPDGKVIKGENPMQMLGGAITFATRYGILSLVGLSPDVDTDADSTSVPIDVTPKAAVNAVIQAFKPVELPAEQVTKLKEDLLGLWEMKKEVAVDSAPAKASSVEQILANGFTKPTKDGEVIELETSELIRIQTWLKGL